MGDARPRSWGASQTFTSMTGWLRARSSRAQSPADAGADAWAEEFARIENPAPDPLIASALPRTGAAAPLPPLQVADRPASSDDERSPPRGSERADDSPVTFASPPLHGGHEAPRACARSRTTATPTGAARPPRRPRPRPRAAAPRALATRAWPGAAAGAPARARGGGRAASCCRARRRRGRRGRRAARARRAQVAARVARRVRPRACPTRRAGTSRPTATGGSTTPSTASCRSTRAGARRTRA